MTFQNSNKECGDTFKVDTHTFICHLASNHRGMHVDMGFEEDRPPCVWSDKGARAINDVRPRTWPIDQVC